jgi:hypothetical protein
MLIWCGSTCFWCEILLKHNFFGGVHDPSKGSFGKILKKFNQKNCYWNGFTTFIALAPTNYKNKT